MTPMRAESICCAHNTQTLPIKKLILINNNLKRNIMSIYCYYTEDDDRAKLYSNIKYYVIAPKLG